jgi:predicted dehydrogenase
MPADEAHRFRQRRHAQPHALRDRQGGARSGLQRHLRQADDVRPGPGRELAGTVEKSGVVFAVTHNYTGYPLVRQAREMILAANWARSTPSAPATSRAGSARGWRTTTKSRPPGGPIRARAAPPAASATSAPTPTTWALHDRPVAGEISATSRRSNKGGAARRLRHGRHPLRERRGGTVTASQISHGRENDLFIEIDGTKGALAMAAGRAEQDDRPPQRRAALR